MLPLVGSGSTLVPVTLSAPAAGARSTVFSLTITRTAAGWAAGWAPGVVADADVFPGDNGLTQRGTFLSRVVEDRLNLLVT